MATQFDVAVIGAGAAGMMCAAVAGQRGKRVVLIDHATRIGEKIRISGGGRCNFTNLGATPAQYLSSNPHFCKSALARYTPADFLELVRRYRIAFHEKHKGQLFCDGSAEQIIGMLQAECEAGHVVWQTGCNIDSLVATAPGFTLHTQRGAFSVNQVVIATGGLSIPKIGATDFAYRIARQFDIKLVPTQPALVPLTFSPQVWAPYAELSGLALPVKIHTGQGKKTAHFDEDMLFTHRGLSGPALLQISSYWQLGTPITVNLTPGVTLFEALAEQKRLSKKSISTTLNQYLPGRLADQLLEKRALPLSTRLADMSDKTLRQLAEDIQAWRLQPDGTEGYRKAEVTLGGVDTHELSQQTLMVQKVPGLYFIGEAVDVTGWLGGYNFQWAWSSAMAAGMAISQS
jgi:predicted Rossmann fold flavoprotein